MGKLRTITYYPSAVDYGWTVPSDYNGLVILQGSNHSGLVLSNPNELKNVIGCNVDNNTRRVGIDGAVVFSVTLVGSPVS